VSKIKLTSHQSEARLAITSFIETKKDQFFLLKGYAGTGKTTIISKVCDWLERQSIRPVLLATTGRAAKVLSDKTNREARTIHSQIYLLGNISEEEDLTEKEILNKDVGQLLLKFDLREKDKKINDEDCIYIVDESSMISNLEDIGGATKFGSGKLLSDFIEYIDGEQIIFVGDPCQLPPVSKNPRSIALDAKFLEAEFNTGVQEFILETVHRTAVDNEIMEYASYFRDNIASNSFVKYPKLLLPKKQEVRLKENSEELLRLFAQCIKKVGVEDSIMIAFSNKQVQWNNLATKNLIHGNTQLKVGDLLMVSKNCIPLDLVNGDHVILEEFSPAEEHAGFRFLNVKLRKVGSDEVKEGLLLDDLLWNDNPSLTTAENQRLMINFAKRMKSNGVDIKSKEFKDKIMSDPHINSIKAKFGYCITCHKAQGGEWRNVFLMMQGSLYGPQMKDEEKYRWLYTALTRAKVHLHFNDGWWVEGWDSRKNLVKKVSSN